MGGIEASVARSERAAMRAGVLPFACALFFGAGLLFLVEPMVGKSVLPLLGGAPASWNDCVLAFQLLLLAGYGYAHLSSRLGARRQALAQVAWLLLALASLRVVQPGRAPSGVTAAGSAGWAAAALVASVGLPFFVLSTSAPVLQGWFASGRHPAARDPYFLYAASNAGSLIALVAYPTLVEPLLPLSRQYRLWQAGYLGYAVLVLACAATLWRAADAADAEDAPGEGRRPGPTPGSSSWALVGGWVALAAVPSSLMLGVTSYLSTDVAAMPLLWTLPLALYLLSFVVAFGGYGESAGRAASRALPMLALLIALLMISGLAVPLAVLVPLHLAAFTAAALACHGELARRRPPAQQLTRYYLWVAVGGALGGLVNALVAPAVFTSVLEYPLALILACALRPAAAQPEPGGDPAQRAWPAAALAWAALTGALTLAVVLWANRATPSPREHAAALAVPLFVAYRLAAHPRRHAAALAAMLLAGHFSEGGYGTVVHAERTFFGVYRIQEDMRQGYRFLMQGTTLHGMQSLDPARRGDPLGYYHRSGPFGEAFAQLPAAARSRVAVVGLGVGALASYARPGQQWTFYEIDPAVERLARDGGYFSFLAACGARCSVAIGDARLSLAAAHGPPFDLIVLDAFSSDAIPVHLVTREAFALYRARLAQGGAILVHFSNRDLALEPVLGRVARELGLSALVGRDRVRPLAGEGRLPSEWMVLTVDAADQGALAAGGRWRAPLVPASAPLWTDDFSSLLGIVRLSRGR